MRSYKKAEVDVALSKDLVSQSLLHFLLGRRVTERLELQGHLPKVVTGHRIAQYSTARFLEVRERLKNGTLLLDFAGKPAIKKK